MSREERVALTILAVGTLLFVVYSGTFSSVKVGANEELRNVPGWDGRPYVLHVPPSNIATRAAPVVIALHGGGGNSSSQKRLTCPGGNLEDERCFHALADREGFIVVYPNGTGSLFSPNKRTWNAGGGAGDYLCSSGYACEHNIDDVGYIRAVLDDLATVSFIDPKRIYVTGISNGSSLSNRLACELADRIAAVGSVGGGNQFSTSAPCDPSRPIPILHIHGTSDPIFPYEGGEGALQSGIRISIPSSVSEWAKRNGCNETPKSKTLADTADDDDTSVIEEYYGGCTAGADVVHYKIVGGGHTWPQGYQYLPTRLIGKTSQDLSANELILGFFKEHPMR